MKKLLKESFDTQETMEQCERFLLPRSSMQAHQNGPLDQQYNFVTRLER